MRWFMVGWVALSFQCAVAGSSVGAAEADYCVVSFVEESDPFYEAVRELERSRDGRVVLAQANEMDSLLTELRAFRPRHVAIVVRPEVLDENLVRRFMMLATQLDNDPFLDFAYGFITGDSAEVAVALAQAGTLAEQKRKKPRVAMIAVAGSGLKESVSARQMLPLRTGYLDQTVHSIAADDAAQGPGDQAIDAKRDEEFLQETMPKLDGHPILLFAGHGFPRQVVGGPSFRHLKERKFDGAVVLNIACYTGVTGAWFDTDWRSMQIRRHEVDPEESFCLSMLKTGVAGYVAYLSPRPAGPTMLGDAITVAISGQSLGELRRADGNSVVLSHLQQGFNSLQTAELADSQPISRKRSVQEFLLASSTGGVLFGDPACVPFESQAETHPLEVTVDEEGDSLVVRVEIVGPLFHFFCSDQITMWDEKTPSFRVEATVPFEKRSVSNVRLRSSSFGDVPHRLIAVVEQHAGKRLLHVKASFPRPEMQHLMKLAQNGVEATFEITTAGDVGTAKIIRKEETR